MKLADHHFFKASDPELSRIVRISTPFPDWLNPFWKDDVVIRAACIPGEVEHSKVYVAREILLGPIRDGLVTQDTLIKEATSGNTGQGLAKICKALGVRCQLIMPAGTARGKVNAISVMGGGIEVVSFGGVGISSTVKQNGVLVVSSGGTAARKSRSRNDSSISVPPRSGRGLGIRRAW